MPRNNTVVQTEICNKLYDYAQSCPRDALSFSLPDFIQSLPEYSQYTVRTAIKTRYWTLKPSYLLLMLVPNATRKAFFTSRLARSIGSDGLNKLLKTLDNWDDCEAWNLVLRVSRHSVSHRAFSVWRRICRCTEPIAEWQHASLRTQTERAAQTLQTIQQTYGAIVAEMIKSYFDDPLTTIGSVGSVAGVSRERVRQWLCVVHDRTSVKKPHSTRLCARTPIQLRTPSYVCRELKASGRRLVPISETVLTDFHQIVNVQHLVLGSEDRLRIPTKASIFADVTLGYDEDGLFWFDHRLPPMSEKIASSIGHTIYLRQTDRERCRLEKAPGSDYRWLQPALKHASKTQKPFGACYHVRQLNETEFLVHFYGQPKYVYVNTRSDTPECYSTSLSARKTLRAGILRQIITSEPRVRPWKALWPAPAQIRECQLQDAECTRACLRLQYDTRLNIQHIATTLQRSVQMINNICLKLYGTLDLALIRQPMTTESFRLHLSQYLKYDSQNAPYLDIDKIASDTSRASRVIRTALRKHFNASAVEVVKMLAKP